MKYLYHNHPKTDLSICEYPEKFFSIIITKIRHS